jgi:hypothetical protein
MKNVKSFLSIVLTSLLLINCPPAGGGGGGDAAGLVLALGGASPTPGTSSTATSTDASDPAQVTPTIRLFEGSNSLADTATLDLGNAVQNTLGTQFTLTIRNNGLANLNLSSSPAVQKSGTDSAQFTVVQPSTTTLTPSSTTNFTIRFTPGLNQTGIKTAQLRIASNDPNTPTFILNLTAKSTAGPEPEIDVRQGSTVYTTNTNTHNFGNVRATLSGTAVTFTIRNLGTANLNLTVPPTLGGANANQFSVNAAGMSSSLAVNDTTTFTVTFSPTSEGTKNASVSIANDDTDEAPFVFNITGFATAAPAPEINVQLVSTSGNILDGSGTYTFSNVQSGSSGSAVQFRIQNLGDLDLTLSGAPIVTIGGTNADQFNVSVQPASSTITAGNSITFSVVFSPTTAGSKSATISFANNDADENPYNFSISGVATAAPAPEINVRQGSTDIASGGTFSGIGSIRIGTTSAATSFTIQNVGNATLNLTGSPRVTISGSDASMFSVVGQPPVTTLSATGTTTFTVNFSPTSTGSKSAVLTIANNDADEGSYTINLSATGSIPAQSCTPVVTTGTRSSNAGSQANFFGTGLSLFWASPVSIATTTSNPSVIYYIDQPHSVTASNGFVFNYLLNASNQYLIGRDGSGNTTYTGLYPYGRNNSEYMRLDSSGTIPTYSPSSGSTNSLRFEINSGVSFSNTTANFRVIQNCNPSLNEEQSFTSSTGSDSSSGLGHVWTYRKKLKIRLIFIDGTYATPTEAGIQTAVDRMKTIYAQNSVKIDLEFTATTLTASEFQTITNVSSDTGLVTGSLSKLYVSSSASQSSDSLNIFFTASNSEVAGVLGISAGIPGVPGLTGTKKSGMIVFLEPHRSSGTAGSALSASDQTFLGDTMAHEAGHFLGLFHTNERGGFNASSTNSLNRKDALSDTPYCLSTRDSNSNGVVDISECNLTGFTNSGASNLMFWAGDGVTAQTQLTGEQGWILRNYPIVY